MKIAKCKMQSAAVAGRPQGPIVAGGYAGKFAAALRAARKRAGLTVPAAAARAQRSKSAWLNYESGRRTPRPGQIAAVFRAVDASPPAFE